MSYSANDLEKIDGVDAVRQNWGMYTTIDNHYGCHHIFAEALDNACDEVINNYADRIDIRIEKSSDSLDNIISITDNGRGMPVDINKALGISGVEMIFTELHAGGKFSDKNYAVSGGLHGVGSVVVNAMSEWLEITVWRDGHEWNIRFEDGYAKGTIQKGKKVAKKKTGSMVRFKPSPDMYEKARFKEDMVKEMIEAKAILLDDCEMVLTNSYGKETIFKYENGITEYLDGIVADCDLFADFSGKIESGNNSASWDIRFSLDEAEYFVKSYVNTVPTSRHGTHEAGFRRGMISALNKFAQSRKILPKNVTFSDADVFSGCFYVVSLFFEKISFDGQTKEKLVDKSAGKFMEAAVTNSTEIWLNQYESKLKEWLDSISKRATARAKSSNEDEKITLAESTGTILPGKLSDCRIKDRQKAELFIVEGDSAGGTTKQARDRTFQAVLPLRGKILNVEGRSNKVAMASETIRNIIVALGIGVRPDVNVSKIRYGKTIILADADVDGSHIVCLFITAMYRLVPEALAGGYIYIAKPPLYRATIGKEYSYAVDESELDTLRKEAEAKNKPFSVTRFKGIGIMDVEQLRETVMDPKNRCLIQVKADNDAEFDKLIVNLMGDKASSRRKFLEEYIA